MTDQPSSDRFKAEMPRIPGVAQPARVRPASHFWFKVAAVAAAVILAITIGFLAAQRMMRPKTGASAATVAPPQIEVAPPAPDPSENFPRATQKAPGIGSVEEMSKPWASKNFFYQNSLTGEEVPALLIRLPGGSASLTQNYWAIAMNAAYGNCKLEYITDLNRLRTDYGYRAAEHPMVGNPCNRTLFDPLKLAELPGNIWVRGAIVQGADVRPPLGIEVKVQGKEILAIQME